jgi:hypothetical protein
LSEESSKASGRIGEPVRYSTTPAVVITAVLANYFGRGRLTPAEAAVDAGELLGDPGQVA